MVIALPYTISCRMQLNMAVVILLHFGLCKRDCMNIEVVFESLTKMREGSDASPKILPSSFSEPCQLETDKEVFVCSDMQVISGSAYAKLLFMSLGLP